MAVVTRGFDCGFGPPPISSAQASPYGGFWATYLRKRTASGIHVLAADTLAAYKGKRPLVFLYEDVDPARMVNSGRAGGAQDAAQALADLAALGITGWQCVYFCADTDTNTSTFPDVAEALRGVATKIPVSKIGLYGEADLIDYIRGLGLAKWFFQPYAWSGKRIASGVHIYQGNSQTLQPWQAVIGGITCDIDEALQANYGQWPAPATPTPPPKPNEEDDVTADDLATIKSYIEHAVDEIRTEASEGFSIANVRSHQDSQGNALAALATAVDNLNDSVNTLRTTCAQILKAVQTS